MSSCSSAAPFIPMDPHLVPTTYGLVFKSAGKYILGFLAFRVNMIFFFKVNSK